MLDKKADSLEVENRKLGKDLKISQRHLKEQEEANSELVNENDRLRSQVRYLSSCELETAQSLVNLN